MSQERRRVWPWLLVAMLGVAGLLWARAVEREARFQRRIEAMEIERDGFKVAAETSQRALDKIVDERDSISAELADLRSVTPAEPERVVVWRTKPGDLDLQRELDRLKQELETAQHAPVDVVERLITPDCPPLPPYRVEARGVNVEVVTEHGNRVALGEVEVWGGFQGASLAKQATLPWRRELTDFQVVAPASTLRNALSVGLATDGIEARYTRLWTRRRIEWYIGAAYDPKPDVLSVVPYEQHRLTEAADRFRVGAGLGVRW